MPIQATGIYRSGYQSGTFFLPAGVKGVRVTGYSEDKPTFSGVLIIHFWDNDSGVAGSNSFVLSGRSNRWINVSHLTPFVTTSGSAPAAVGDWSVSFVASTGAFMCFEAYN